MTPDEARARAVDLDAIKARDSAWVPLCGYCGRPRESDAHNQDGHAFEEWDSYDDDEEVRAADRRALLSRVAAVEAVEADVARLKAMLKECVETMEVAALTVHMHKEGMTFPDEPRMETGCESCDRDGSLMEMLEETMAKAREALALLRGTSAGRGEE